MDGIISGYRSNLEATYCFLADCYLREPKFVPMTALLEKNLEFLHKSLNRSELYKQFEHCYTNWLTNPRFRRKIQEDYTRLFQQPMIVTPGLLPSETYYRDQHISVKQYTSKSAQEIVSFYKSACPDFILNSGEAPDHIGNELIFAGKLSREEVKAEQSGNWVMVNQYAHLRYSFFAKHLLVWLPDFCRYIHAKASTAFYRMVADLTNHFVRQDYDNLQARFEAQSEQVAGYC